MTTLIYNSSQNVEYTRNQLAALPTPNALGRFHSPYGFAEYVDQIHNNLDIAGITVNAEEYVTSHENNRLFGALAVTIPSIEGEYVSADDWEFVIGLRGSHDQSIQRGLVLGNRVMVCSNLCFSGDLGDAVNTKQTTNIRSRIASLVAQTVDLIPEGARRQVQRVESYRNTELSPRHGDAALVELLRRDAISPPQLGRAVAEWDQPSHVEHAEHGHSVWRLLNAVTEAQKPQGSASVNPLLIEQRTRRASTFLDEVVGLEF